MGKFEQPRNNREEAELEEAFHQVTGSNKTKKQAKEPEKNTAAKQVSAKNREKSNKGAIIAICIAAAFVLVGAITGVLYYIFYSGDDGLILKNVYVAGVNVGGMAPEEAKNVLHLSTDNTYTQKDMIIQLPNEEIRLSPADTKVQLDVDAAVEAAYNYGREGTNAEQRKARRKAERDNYVLDLIPYLNLDTAYIQSVMDELSIQYNTTLTQPTVTISGERPSLNPDELDEEAEPQILTLTLGVPESALDITTLYGMVVDGYSNNVFNIQMDFSVLEPDAPDLEAIFEKYCAAPVDAVLDTNTYEITPEIYGYGFDIEAVQKLIEQAKNGETLEISLGYITPAATVESISSTLFQDILGSCETYQYSGYNRANNLQLACAAINGLILKPGETFSYNKALGERTTEKGYLGAAAYVGGETVTSIGGGICQVSSSLYYSALHADLEIVERVCHQYPSSYVPLGMDATVNWGTIDFKFKNNTNYPIKIEAYASDNGRVEVKLTGTDEKDYYVEMSYSVLKTYNWEEVIKDIKPEDNTKGYKDGEVISTPYTGYDVNTYKSKYNKETGELISTEFETFSSYDKRDRVICNIVEPEPEPTVPETTVPETTAPTENPDGFQGTASEG